MAGELLTAEGLGKVYPGGSRALVEATFGLSRGEFVAIIGSSGAGKSTLLRCMNRLLEPTEGVLRLGGEDVTHVHGRALLRVRQRVGMVFQSFNLVGRLTVLENVLAGRSRFNQSAWRLARSVVRSYSRAEREAAFECLRFVGIERFAYRRASQLSGGQQQRVAIARALAQEPEVMLADEPIASLDPRSAGHVMDTLRRITDARGTPMVVNLHQVDVARSHASRIVGMRAGRIVFDGPASSLDDRAVREIYGSEPHEAVDGDEAWAGEPSEGAACAM